MEMERQIVSDCFRSNPLFTNHKLMPLFWGILALALIFTVSQTPLYSDENSNTTEGSSDRVELEDLSPISELDKKVEQIEIEINGLLESLANSDENDPGILAEQEQGFSRVIFELNEVFLKANPDDYRISYKIQRLEDEIYTLADSLGNSDLNYHLPATIRAPVVRVKDGDTIVVKILSRNYCVRYVGMNTPELKDKRKQVKELAFAAKEKNQELVLGKIVTLVKDVSDTDKYGRLLRFVYVDDLFVNAKLVKQGYARVSTYPPDVHYVEFFKEMEQEARELELGLWSS